MLRIVRLSVALATACVLVPSVAAAQDACKKLTSEQDAFTGERVTRLSAAEASERQINSRRETENHFEKSSITIDSSGTTLQLELRQLGATKVEAKDGLSIELRLEDGSVVQLKTTGAVISNGQFAGVAYTQLPMTFRPDRAAILALAASPVVAIRTPSPRGLITLDVPASVAKKFWTPGFACAAQMLAATPATDAPAAPAPSPFTPLEPADDPATPSESP